MKLLLLTAVLAASLLSVPSVTAAPRQQTLVVSPDQVAVGDNVVFSGCGYTKNSRLGLSVSSEQTGLTGYYVFVATDADGCFTTASAPFVPQVAGSYFVDTASAKQPNTNTTGFFTVSL